MDLLTDSEYQVELEKELSVKKQYLDIVIIQKMPSQSVTSIERKFYHATIKPFY